MFPAVPGNHISTPHRRGPWISFVEVKFSPTLVLRTPGSNSLVDYLFQTLSQLFGDWDPIYYHDSVKKMNDLHRSMGVPLKDSIGHTEAESNGLLDKKPWVMVAPMMSAKNNFIKHMKTKYDVITIGFSGWANSKKFGFSRGTDYSIPLSDHCDYNELIELVKKSEAEKVYTIHGFVDEFAMDLNKLGFTAQPLREISLDNFC